VPSIFCNPCTFLVSTGFGLLSFVTQCVSAAEDEVPPKVVVVIAEAWPKLTDQGLTLKCMPPNGKPALVTGGDCLESKLWAVYEEYTSNHNPMSLPLRFENRYH